MIQMMDPNDIIQTLDCSQYFWKDPTLISGWQLNIKLKDEFLKSVISQSAKSYSEVSHDLTITIGS
jgi:hypothetical protein